MLLSLRLCASHSFREVACRFAAQARCLRLCRRANCDLGCKRLVEASCLAGASPCVTGAALQSAVIKFRGSSRRSMLQHVSPQSLICVAGAIFWRVTCRFRGCRGVELCGRRRVSPEPDLRVRRSALDHGVQPSWPAQCVVGSRVEFRDRCSASGALTDRYIVNPALRNLVQGLRAEEPFREQRATDRHMHRDRNLHRKYRKRER